MSAKEGVSVENLTFQTSQLTTEQSSAEERANNQAHIIGQSDSQASCARLDLDGAPLSAAAKVTKQHRIAGESPVRNTIVQGVS